MTHKIVEKPKDLFFNINSNLYNFQETLGKVEPIDGSFLNISYLFDGENEKCTSFRYETEPGVTEDMLTRYISNLPITSKLTILSELLNQPILNTNHNLNVPTQYLEEYDFMANQLYILLTDMFKLHMDTLVSEDQPELELTD
jgi:hypothetical protein